MSLSWIVVGLIVIAGSGIPGLFVGRSTVGSWVSTILIGAGSLSGLVGVCLHLFGYVSPPLSFPWPWTGVNFSIHVDALAAIFLLPIFMVTPVASLFGQGYWPQINHPQNGQRIRFFLGILPASMALLVLAENGILFLFAWEGMALSAYFLVITEDDDPQVCKAGWVYFVSTHMVTLVLFAFFALLRSASGSYAFRQLEGEGFTPAMANALFLLAIVGFGTKAGIMPMHFWLPGAHANAPSHVSALMSGVILKMGVYGVLRTLSFFPSPPLWWGILLLVLGMISGVFGIIFAISQQDMKRLLAYSSIENIGIIFAGIGLATAGRSLNRADWIVLGLSGSLLHVLNHSLYKGMLFLGSGSILHAVHTRRMDQLGGLAKRMPWTFFLFLVGAMGVCALPPLNGFVSEFMLYLGFFRALGIGEAGSWEGIAFAAPALGMMGALSVVCFVKAVGVIFLGEPRTDAPKHAHESGKLLLAPMFTLAAAMVAIGIVPITCIPILQPAITEWNDALPLESPTIESLVPLEWIGIMSFAMLVTTAVVGRFLWGRIRETGYQTVPTWDCGYARPTPRMQYTGTSLAEIITKQYRWLLRSRVESPRVNELFPPGTSFSSETPDPVLDDAIEPSFAASARFLDRLRRLQQPGMELSLLFIFATLVGLLFWR
ncbi:MAG: proton-conducting transporter membrane subunit [Planctomycetota bacterium]